MRFLFTSCLILIGLLSYGTETKILIRAKAKDAKFIGSSIGGAHIKVIDNLTGRILASGITTGSTGNTNLIMKTPIERGKPITDEKTAGFLATVDIQEPTFVKIIAKAPINQRQALIESSTELWLIPGKDMIGEGVILEIPGFIVDVLSPRTHEKISLETIDNSILIQSNIVMTCGCPIIQEGIWDANKVEVVAIVKKYGVEIERIKMQIVKASLFQASFIHLGKGNYEITVFAFNSSSNNTGLDKVNFIIN